LDFGINVRFMGHRIRKACKNNDAILSGIIEMDETCPPFVEIINLKMTNKLSDIIILFFKIA
jgi:hypothetical protein